MPDVAGQRARLLLLEVDDLATMLLVTTETFDRRAAQASAAVAALDDAALRARLAERLAQVHDRADRPPASHPVDGADDPQLRQLIAEPPTVT